MQAFTSFIAYLVFLASISHTVPQTLDSNTVPAYPTQTQSQICRLDLSNELFGGVNAACGGGPTLDRSRCCPVLAAWLFAAHARTALEVSAASSPPPSGDLPMMPADDSQKCVNSLQDSLRNRSIRIPQPNATCDAILCFCGIRLHHITSLTCPNAFNVTTALRNASSGGTHNATPTAIVRNLEKNCRNASYAGCTQCLIALQKIKGNNKKESESERAKKMFNRDCQLMALTWLLGRNKTAYIPTVSAVLRAVMYSAHPHESTCSPDQENMPLAVDSLRYETSKGSSSPLRLFWIVLVIVLILFCM
ncbi:uncharacterized GPI-anchored protein At4g28100-like [Glycine soja]|uniref:Putative GPI-anchored protein n=1 Tax=Glycine soja TaxID=3848 RepID=A0A445HSW8_GLYSO|nr:uncharacterized GPI-anchored protein At4g28100-like [Glycine soja]RZB76766.1 putative GPI-anchored protein [Glycine soja]